MGKTACTCGYSSSYGESWSAQASCHPSQNQKSSSYSRA
ncbi:hypothetical protein TREES_T100016886 [Tupaia chinensis]|uniref:Uncharacterized protein n=1 Tax=Tupaia chinensis TaxID=246437 RepID=L9L1K4_TUPCH|nr:hypothetical protein TREES_T100016886 [Tupaia chinensis]